jgi:hypothetical protein
MTTRILIKHPEEFVARLIAFVRDSKSNPTLLMEQFIKINN